MTEELPTAENVTAAVGTVPAAAVSVWRESLLPEKNEGATY